MQRIRILVLCALAAGAIGLAIYLGAANSIHAHRAPDGAAQAAAGPLSNATVSFGGWMTPLDRVTATPLQLRQFNHHALSPQVVKIKAGGAVNFIIGGFHQLLVYDDGTKPGDIDTSVTVAPANQPQPPLIADPGGRLYRGLDPSTQPQDRVEVVHFAEPGTYLVICGVLPHFQEGMYGYVQVVP